jgi:hypothetical protein
MTAQQPLDLDAIQNRAEAAMSGPWRYSPFRLAPGVVKPTPDGKATDYVVAQMVNAGKDTAEHIAGMDPQTTLALVAELHLHRAFRDKVRRALGHNDSPVYVMGEVGVSLLELDNRLTS